ncbi:MAG: hypothetical protein V4689_00465 [Verrucomicrobiota bacterium]
MKLCDAEAMPSTVLNVVGVPIVEIVGVAGPDDGVTDAHVVPINIEPTLTVAALLLFPWRSSTESIEA